MDVPKAREDTVKLSYPTKKRVVFDWYFIGVKAYHVQ
jgi:hypothetical protein